MNVVLASNNAGKLRELKAILSPLNWQLKAQAELGIEDALEDGLSFVENALIKARHASRLAQCPAIADDSGLEVDYLKGAPGIYSARYSGEGANSLRNNAKLLEALSNIPDDKRTARFWCCMVYMRHADDPAPIIAQASWQGRILHAAQGDEGFGYDPIFYVPSHRCAAAALSAEEKNRISHRAQALKKLLQALNDHYAL